MAIVTRITDLFGCRHPFQQAGMGGVETPDLALAVAAAGGIGMLNADLPAPLVSSNINAVPADAAIGINFLVPFLDPSVLELASAAMPYVELFWGDPDEALVATAHTGGALAGWQVGSAIEAQAAVDAGCDVVVTQGVEAGGHVRGTTGLLPLLDEVRAVIDVPIIAAGGIGTGRAMAAAIAAGADAVRVGTRFIAAHEYPAHPAYVDALIAATAEDTTLTTAFGEGWPDAPHRVLRSAVEAGERLGDAQSWSPMWPRRHEDGPIEARCLYAGQSVGAVRSRQPAGAIVQELVDEAERVLAGPS
ncbi:MAG: nitronate monooxygenase [Actinobacteria bacterium]|nr:nitronate monooxygenase [Actinomycetota bacterium]